MRSKLRCLIFVSTMFFILTIVNGQTKIISSHESGYLPRRNPLVGLHFTETKFIGATPSKFNAGYQLSYLDGIRGKYDYMIQFGSTSTNGSVKKETNETIKDLVHTIQFTVMRRVFSDSVRINPFVSAGVAGNFYSNSLAPGASFGAGIQFKLSKNIYLFTQASYNWNSYINNSWQGNVGLHGSVFHRKKKSAVIVQTVSQQGAADRDGDGIPDSEDTCPDVPGSVVFHGCPDSDGDGIPDNLDSCVSVPGFVEYRGCPPPSALKDSSLNKNNTKTAISDSINNAVTKIASSIRFKTNSALLTDSSTILLKEISALLKQHPSYLLAIHGHTDNIGTDKANIILSTQRATTVKDFLISQGIDGARLSAEGFGASQPVADNNTEYGRKQNRRTEFILIQP